MVFLPCARRAWCLFVGRAFFTFNRELICCIGSIRPVDVPRVVGVDFYLGPNEDKDGVTFLIVYHTYPLLMICDHWQAVITRIPVIQHPPPAPAWQVSPSPIDKWCHELSIREMNVYGSSMTLCTIACSVSQMDPTHRYHLSPRASRRHWKKISISKTIS